MRIAAVGQQNDGESGLGEDAQEGRLSDGVAVVPDHPDVLVRAPAEADPAQSPGVAAERVRVGDLGLELRHRFGALGRQHPATVGGQATGQVHPCEAQHVVRPGGDQAGRSDGSGQPADRRLPQWTLVPAADVPDRVGVQDHLFRQGDGRGQAERLADPLRQGLVPGRFPSASR